MHSSFKYYILSYYVISIHMSVPLHTCTVLIEIFVTTSAVVSTSHDICIIVIHICIYICIWVHRHIVCSVIDYTRHEV